MFKKDRINKNWYNITLFHKIIVTNFKFFMANPRSVYTDNMRLKYTTIFELKYFKLICTVIKYRHYINLIKGNR
jgi:hypothetical protein